MYLYIYIISDKMRELKNWRQNVSVNNPSFATLPTLFRSVFVFLSGINAKISKYLRSQSNKIMNKLKSKSNIEFLPLSNKSIIQRKREEKKDEVVKFI
uniref:Uncharacterized protein n=1 Tax=Heterorhabditis bacteriophora TaxID=37862 RepID=A0A1I7W9E9_HETBA